ncbi:unnamed protein product [Rotaria sp. Silwood2]|nr:unnamed protein product [Rotaria sp. Silwood2]CAF2979444.1 unnamed protein product [Rotaria sp. Silwood2]CAF3113681.1 unnamed protein product [Rotaria sp. Silwood2]CAF3204786.1 unnamed protein product [Rotaria sp. Silwood2]
MSLRDVNIKWEDIDEYLKSIGFLRARTSHKWAAKFIKEDYEELLNDLRGGKHTDLFFYKFSEVEADAKAFVVAAYSQKSEDFKAIDLA